MSSEKYAKSPLKTVHEEFTKLIRERTNDLGELNKWKNSLRTLLQDKSVVEHHEKLLLDDFHDEIMEEYDKIKEKLYPNLKKTLSYAFSLIHSSEYDVSKKGEASAPCPTYTMHDFYRYPSFIKSDSFAPQEGISRLHSSASFFSAHADKKDDLTSRDLSILAEASQNSSFTDKKDTLKKTAHSASSIVLEEVTNLIPLTSEILPNETAADRFHTRATALHKLLFEPKVINALSGGELEDIREDLEEIKLHIVNDATIKESNPKIAYRYFKGKDTLEEIIKHIDSLFTPPKPKSESESESCIIA